MVVSIDNDPELSTGNRCSVGCRPYVKYVSKKQYGSVVRVGRPMPVHEHSNTRARVLSELSV